MSAPVSVSTPGFGRRSALLGGAALLAAARTARAASPIKVGVVLYARDSQYWQQIERGMRDAAGKLDVRLMVELSNRQLATEAQVVDDLCTRGIDALVISPLDRTASANALRNAKQQGVLTVEYNTLLADQTISPYTVGVDDRDLAASVGRAVAEHVRRDLGGNATMGLITLPPINSGSAVRRAGFLSAFDGIHYRIVGETSGSTPDQGANGLETILQRDPDTQVIWASNSGTLSGAAAAARHLSASARLYGIDMSAELAQMMLDPAGKLDAVSDQQPYRIGYRAIEVVVAAKQGRQQPRSALVPVKLYSRSNPVELHAYLDFIASLKRG